MSEWHRDNPDLVGTEADPCWTPPVEPPPPVDHDGEGVTGRSIIDRLLRHLDAANAWGDWLQSVCFHEDHELYDDVMALRTTAREPS